LHIGFAGGRINHIFEISKEIIEKGIHFQEDFRVLRHHLSARVFSKNVNTGFHSNIVIKASNVNANFAKKGKIKDEGRPMAARNNIDLSVLNLHSCLGSKRAVQSF
jgi:hypothetical protein